MKIRVNLIVAIIAVGTLLIVAGTMFCQDIPTPAVYDLVTPVVHPTHRPEYYTRTVATFSVGSNAGLGFKTPSISATIGLELPITSRLELLPSFTISPDRKTFSDTGHTQAITINADYFFTHYVGAFGGADYSEYWASQPQGPLVCTPETDIAGAPSSCNYAYTTPLHKAGFVPSAGAVIRDSWFGPTAPGRAYISYIFPTGCVWASQCALPADGVQSNRIHGIHGYQEFRLLQVTPDSALRFGISASWLNFCDQSNPLVIVKRVCHNTGTLLMTMTLELGHLDKY